MRQIGSHITRWNLIHFAEDSFYDEVELDANLAAIEFMINELKVEQREAFLVAFSSAFLQVAQLMSSLDDYDDIFTETIDLVEDILVTLDEDHEEKEIEWVVNFSILLYDYFIEREAVDELLSYRLYEIRVTRDRYSLLFGDEGVNDTDPGIFKRRH